MRALPKAKAITRNLPDWGGGGTRTHRDIYIFLVTRRIILQNSLFGSCRLPALLNGSSVRPGAGEVEVSVVKGGQCTEGPARLTKLDQ